jgi:hypothetical protein
VHHLPSFYDEQILKRVKSSVLVSYEVMVAVTRQAGKDNLLIT